MECVKKFHCNKYIHFKIASNAKVTKKVTSLLEDILIHILFHLQIIKEKKIYFKVDSKLAEQSGNHIFHILTALSLVLQIVFQIVFHIYQICHKNCSEV